MYPFLSLATGTVNTAANAAPGPAFPALTSLPTGAWDLVSALQNAGAYVKTGGGALLVLMGLAALVWGGVLLLKKLMGGQQNQDSYMKIIALMIVGGAIAVGGFSLIFTIGSGGQKTINDLGGATFLWDAGQPLGLLLGLG